MSHEVMESRLNDYVDGTLAPAAVHEVEAHLERCAACRDELAALRALLDEAAALSRSIDPPRDLWPDIDARIEDAEAASPAPRLEAAGRSLRSMRYPLAAAAVVLVVASSAVTALLLSGRGSPQIASLPPAVAGDAWDGSPVARWHVAEGEYLRAAAELLEALEAARGRLPPAAVQTIESNLRILDAAIRESRAALALDPVNGQLLEMLSATYRKKLELLQHVNRLAAEL
jgi:hypothetical protein